MADMVTIEECITRLDAIRHEIVPESRDYFALSAGIAALYELEKDTPAANRWISCSERLPENKERVLVCFRSGTVHIAVWYGDYDEKGAWKVTSQFPTKLYRTDTIPKWMPMPDAYEPPESEVQSDDEA